MSDVFISYSRKDSDFVHKLDDSLRREKRDVWVDWQDIARGEDWWHSIQVGVDSTDTALIVVTEHWLVSEICQRELDYIRGQNKRVFPIMREKIEGDLAIRVKGTWVDQEWENRARDNWKYIRSLNWLFFDDDTTFDSVFKDLLMALDTDQLYVKSHTRYLVRALEWQQFQRNPSFLLEGDQLASAKTWLDSSANKHPEPHPVHHEYVGASNIAETARIARDKAREELIRRFRQMAIILGVLVVVALIVAGIVGQQFFSARAEVTKAGATLQQVNIQVTNAINQQSTAVAQVQVAEALVGTATIEQGNAILAQRTSAAREQAASTQVAVAGETLSPVPPTLTAVASAISDAFNQQDIANGITNASIHLLDKDFTGALQIMDNIVSAYPDQSLAYIGRGLVLDSLDRLDDAIADYTTAIKLDSENSGAYTNRALIYSKQGIFDKAIADYNTALQLDPSDVDNYLGRGDIYEQQEDYEHALADYATAIQVNPGEYSPYVSRGLLYENTGRYDEALLDYQKALQINPQSVQAYTGLGNLYIRKKDFEKSLSYFNQAIEIDPKYAIAYFSRATVYEGRDELDKAIADYLQAINIDPKFTDAYYYLGTDYQAQDKLDLAMESYDEAINVDSTYAKAYIKRAGLYAQMDNVEEASADYLKWIELNQNASDQSTTVTQTQLPYTTTVTMTEGYSYSIPFEGRAGQLLQASALAQEGDSAEVDALLVLLDPQGKPIMSADDHDDSYDAVINDFALPTDGLYTLVVSYSQSGSEGDLDVTLNLRSAAEATPAS